MAHGTGLSSRTFCRHRGSARSRRGLHVCRITNTGEELDRPASRIFNPPELMRDGVPLHLTVRDDYVDGIADDKISTEDMEYWFQEEEGLLNNYLEEAEVLPNVDFTLKNFGAGRAPILDLTEGQVITGVVTALHLYHGAVIDIGCEWDGLVPVTEEQWADPAVLAELDLGVEVQVRVHKLRDWDIFRFPVQLELLTPDLSHLLVPPHEWRAPVVIRPDTDIAKLIALARPDYVPYNYDFEDPTEMLPEMADTIDQLTFEELYGPNAPQPEEEGCTEEGEIFMDYESWQATQVAAHYF